MTHDDQQFFKELGARIAQLRKDAGSSQQAVSMLPTLAEVFGVSIDELLGLHRNGAGKRGPTPLLQKRIERLNRLPKAEQKVVLKMLDGVLSHTSR